MRLFGGFLMAVGMLIMLASGLCSLVFAKEFGSGGPAGLIGVIVLFGGVPFGFGLLVFWTGKSLCAKPRPGPMDKGGAG